MLTHKAKYALKAILVLARRADEGPIMIGELAQAGGVPKKFLELILLELRNKGVLQSRRGKLGGYMLNVSPRKITVGDIVRMVDGPMAPVQCLSKTAYRRCPDCTEEGTCGVRLALKEAYEASLIIMEKTTIDDILNMMESSQGAETENAMFYI